MKNVKLAMLLCFQEGVCFLKKTHYSTFEMKYSKTTDWNIIFSTQATQEDTERHKPQLKLVRELAETLKGLLRSQENLIDDKVSLLNCNWIAVTSRSEQWLKLLLVSNRSKQPYDPFLSHFISGKIFLVLNMPYKGKFISFQFHISILFR